MYFVVLEKEKSLSKMYRRKYEEYKCKARMFFPKRERGTLE